MIVCSGRKSRSLSSLFPDSMTVSSAFVPMSVKNFSVTLDCKLTSQIWYAQPILNSTTLVPSIFFSSQMPQKFLFLPLFFHALATAILLSGCPQYLLNYKRFKAILLTLSWGVPQTNHISAHLATLLWLPTDPRIQYKLTTLCYKCLNLTAPIYLTELLTVYKPSCQLCSSSDTSIFCLPSHSLGQIFFLCCTICLKQPPLPN